MTKKARALVLIAMLCAATLPAGAQAGGAGGSAREVVLFAFDDYGIPFTKGLLLNLVPGRKTAGDHGSGADPLHPNRPVIMPGPPGSPDHPRAYYYGTVIQVGDEYRMWYTGMDSESRRLVCYALSRDGIEWKKPNLGLVEYSGGKQNNLVLLDGKSAMPGAISLVLYEPDDPDPERRFKMVREVSPTQILAAFSSDGLRWKSFAGNPIIQGSGLEPSGLIRFKDAYYLNGHGGPIPHPIKGAQKRMMVTYVSYDFENWTRAAHVSFRRNSIPPTPPVDFEPHRGEQVHVGASLWNRGNVVLGFYGQYHNQTNDRRTSSCDIGLLISNDAIHFKEPIPDFKIIPSYEEPDDAEPRLLQGQGFENIGDRTLFWYGIWVASNPKGPTGVRVATWPRDRLGYFSPAPRAQDPHFISTVIPPQGLAGRVYVNADGVSDQNQLRVEILSDRLVPVPGFSGAESIPVTQSGFRQPVTWRGKDRLDNPTTPIRVRVSWVGPRPEEVRVYAAYVE